MVLVSLRIPAAMKAELDRLAADAGSDRSVVGRRMWADGIRRARTAPAYAARFAPEEAPRA
jgi:predicted transcriptional regulator